jgi:hypothetical protein
LRPRHREDHEMPFATTNDGVRLYYEETGDKHDAETAL